MTRSLTKSSSERGSPNLFNNASLTSVHLLYKEVMTISLASPTNFDLICSNINYLKKNVRLVVLINLYTFFDPPE